MYCHGLKEKGEFYNGGTYSLVRPGDGGVLVPPARCRKGDVKSENEAERNHVHESRTEDDYVFVDSEG